MRPVCLQPVWAPGRLPRLWQTSADVTCQEGAVTSPIGFGAQSGLLSEKAPLISLLKFADMLEVEKACPSRDLAWDKVGANCDRKPALSGGFHKGFVYVADRNPLSGTTLSGVDRPPSQKSGPEPPSKT